MCLSYGHFFRELVTEFATDFPNSSSSYPACSSDRKNWISAVWRFIITLIFNNFILLAKQKDQFFFLFNLFLYRLLFWKHPRFFSVYYWKSLFPRYESQSSPIKVVIKLENLCHIEGKATYKINAELMYMNVLCI